MRNKSNKERITKGWVALAAVAFMACSGNNGKTKNETVSDSGKRSETVKTEAEEPVLSGSLLEGKKVYDQYCLTCHQAKGSGVPNLNPPLKGTEYVLGDKQRLIGIVLKGSNEGLNVNGMTYSNAMPPHQFLSDQQIAQVLSYVRNSFGNQADTVSESEVKTVRAAL